MRGPRIPWPAAPFWLRRRIELDVDQVEHGIPRGHLWRVTWAEAESLHAWKGPVVELELIQVNYRVAGVPGIFARYVVDSTVWVSLDSLTSSAFFQVISFGNRADAQLHYDRLKARLPKALTP